MKLTKTDSTLEGIIYQGQVWELEYEELCDLICHYRDTGPGPHHFELKPTECNKVFGTLLPKTDY